MKTENILQGNTFLQQPRPARDEKRSNKKDNVDPIEEKVDLSKKTSTFLTDPSPTCAEIAEMLKQMDFSQLRGSEWISKEGRANLQMLL